MNCTLEWQQKKWEYWVALRLGRYLVESHSQRTNISISIPMIYQNIAQLLTHPKSLVWIKFCYILVTWDTTQLRWMFLPRLWRWRTTRPSSPDTLRICFYGFKYGLRIHTFRSIWPCLIVKVLVTWVKFLEPSSYWTVINCTFTFQTTNAFICFCSVMA